MIKFWHSKASSKGWNSFCNNFPCWEKGWPAREKKARGSWFCPRLLRSREHEWFIHWSTLDSFALPTAGSIECFINNRTHNVLYFLSTYYLPRTQQSALPALIWANFHNSVGDRYWKKTSFLQLNSERAAEIENLSWDRAFGVHGFIVTKTKIKNILNK